MKVDPYLHAVLLLYGSGKEVSAESIKNVLKAAGLEPDEAKAKVLAEAVKGVDIEALLKEATITAPVVQAQVAEKKEEEKPKEEKKEEEVAAAGLASLFG
jgi:large subunit ribosomal protein L12